MSAHYPGTVKCIKERALSILVRDQDGKEFFVPRSVLADDSQVKGEGDDGILAVRSWFAEKEGW
jgi:hypothetical protein